MRKLNGIMIAELLKECGFLGYEIEISSKKRGEYVYKVLIIDAEKNFYKLTVEDFGVMSYVINMYDKKYSEPCYKFVHKLLEKLV